MENILIIPIGSIDPDILDSIGRALRETYRCEADSGKSLPVPHETYNSRRGQYHSTEILKILSNFKGDRLLLGVIEEDLYVPQLNFVFGEAAPAAGVAIVALLRLRQEFYGLKPDRELLLLRSQKEAIHELGHIFGLGHCPNPKCIMHFSNSLPDTDIKEKQFCTSCKNKLTRQRT